MMPEMYTLQSVWDKGAAPAGVIMCPMGMKIGTQRRSNVQRRHESTEAVLAAALDMFVQQGYAATSMADIAARAGLTKGAVYHYFKDKESLLLALLDRSESTLYEPAFLEIRASNGNAQDQLAMFLNWVARAGGENKELMLLPVLVSLEFFGFGNDAERRVRQMYDRLHAELERILKLGQAGGAFDDEADASTLAVSLVAMIDGLLLEWYRFGNRIDGPALARAARNLVLRGVASA